MRVFLTGATGFIGAHLLERLLADGRLEVGVLIRSGADPWRIADRLERCETIRGDLGELDAARAAIVAFKPEVVIHAGWMGVDRLARNSPAQIKNVESTATLVEIAGEAGARAWVGLGSQAEYGPQNSTIHEQTEPRPTTLYGIAKHSARMVAERLCTDRGMRFAWFRVFSCYGPMDSPNTLVSTLIAQLLRGERPALTEGTQSWDYLHARDAAEAIVRVALAPRLFGTFNLGSGRPETIRNVAERIRDLIDPNLPLGFGEVPIRPGQPTHLVADISHLRDRAGWAPAIDLGPGLEETIAWFRNCRAVAAPVPEAPPVKDESR